MDLMAAGRWAEGGRQDRQDIDGGSLDRMAARAHHTMGGFAVQRIARADELEDARPRVGRLQQRAHAIVAQAMPQLAGSCLQVNDEAACAHELAVLRHRDGAAGGQHDAFTARQFVDEMGLAPAKTVLAFEFEDRRHRHATARFELSIGIDEDAAQQVGNAPTHGRLAATHHADQADWRAGTQNSRQGRRLRLDGRQDRWGALGIRR